MSSNDDDKSSQTLPNLSFVTDVNDDGTITFRVPASFTKAIAETGRSGITIEVNHDLYKASSNNPVIRQLVQRYCSEHFRDTAFGSMLLSFQSSNVRSELCVLLH